MEPTLRITLLGPAHSGKTSYLKLIQNEHFSVSYETTPGPQLHLIKHKPGNRIIHAWEIGSTIPRDSKSRAEIINSQLKASDAVLVFCDLSDAEALAKIANEFSPQSLKKKCANPAAKFILIGTKTHPEAPQVISNGCLEDFARQQKFDGYFDLRDTPENSFKLCIDDALTTRRAALIEKIDRYCHQRYGERLKSLVAYIAWTLGLTYFFGHSKEEDKLTAAVALKIALCHSSHHLSKLTAPQKAAYHNGRLSDLFRQATPFIQTSEAQATPRVSSRK